MTFDPKMKYFFLISIILLSFCTICSAENPIVAKVIKSKNEVRFYWSDVFSIDGKGEIEPLHRLARELKTSLSPKFRLIWSIGSPTYPSYSTILYDRINGKLSYYSQIDVSSMESEGMQSPYVLNWQISGVKDKYIQSLAKKYSNPSTGSGDAYFSELVYFGCKIRYLRKH